MAAMAAKMIAQELLGIRTRMIIVSRRVVFSTIKGV